MKFTISYTVPSAALDSRCAMSTLAFVTLAQDLAASHYGAGGLSIPHLQKKGLTWVVTRQRFVIHEYPLWVDRLQVSTWAKPPRGPFCFRDFAYTYAPGGRFPTLDAALSEGASPDSGSPSPVFSGTSCWMVLDTETGKPIKPGSDIFSGIEFDSDDALPSVFPRFDVPQDKELCSKNGEFSPTFLDIDINGHVNNLNYIRWALADAPESVTAGNLVSEIDTYFLSQAKIHDRLRVESAVEGGEKSTGTQSTVHRILRGGEELFRARFTWRPEGEMGRPVAVG